MKATIIYRHQKEDTDCGGDYYAIKLQLNGETVAEFGDSYHDSGYEKAIGFIQGVEYITKEKISIDYESIADFIDF